MKNPICEELAIFQPTGTQDEEVYWWYIVNSVLNAFLTISAIILNSVTIQALRKTSSLPKPLKTLLLNLVVSDLGVGLLVEPFYFGLLVSWLQRHDSTNATCTTFLSLLYLFSAASLSGVMALSGDRFLAVHLHLRYQELVTHKRIFAVVISIWMFSAFLSLFHVWVSTNIFSMLIVIIGVVYLVFSAMFYLKIYCAVRRHKNQIHAIQALQVAQNDRIANAARLRKSAVGVFYVYLAFLLCYLPKICSFAVVVISGSVGPDVNVFFSFSTTLLFLNSSLNPVIYCWKMRHIRSAVSDIVRNIISKSLLRKDLVNNGEARGSHLNLGTRHRYARSSSIRAKPLRFA